MGGECGEEEAMFVEKKVVLGRWRMLAEIWQVQISLGEYLKLVKMRVLVVLFSTLIRIILNHDDDGYIGDDDDYYCYCYYHIIIVDQS